MGNLPWNVLWCGLFWVFFPPSLFTMQIPMFITDDASWKSPRAASGIFFPECVSSSGLLESPSGQANLDLLQLLQRLDPAGSDHKFSQRAFRKILPIPSQGCGEGLGNPWMFQSDF